MSITRGSKVLLVMSTFTSKFQNMFHPISSYVANHQSFMASLDGMAWGSYVIISTAMDMHTLTISFTYV
jgi:hypothetical protein